MNFSGAVLDAAQHMSLMTPNLQPTPHTSSFLKPLGSRFYLSTPALGLFLIFSLYLRWLSSSSRPVAKGPVVGYRSYFEPTFLLRLRFVFDAVNIMNEGYRKYKNKCFVVRRMDTDVTMLPVKYLDELRKCGRDELNARNANIDNVLGHYTNLHEMKSNEQFTNVITHCLNPNINEFMREVQDELNHALKVDMPDFEGHEWKSVDVHALLRRVVSRLALRVMLGLPYCRNETMIAITEWHTICIFAVALILRKVPPILHPVVSWFVPYRWGLLRNLRRTKTITRPILEKYQAAGIRGGADQQPAEPKTLFKWMVETAKPHQSSLHSMVSVQLAVTVAAVYTSSQATSHLLVFLATHPEIVEELRQEITDHTDDLEKIDHRKLHKMEACLAETLRIHPPMTNAPQRLAMQEITLKDGVVIPADALVAFPCSPVALDPSIYPEPHQFKIRPEGLNSPVTTPTTKHLAFGWGVQACPGRFFAAKEIKMVTARLVMEYDLHLTPESAQMRRAYDIEDLRVLNPRMRVNMRRRLPSDSGLSPPARP